MSLSLSFIFPMVRIVIPELFRDDEQAAWSNLNGFSDFWIFRKLDSSFTKWLEAPVL